MDLLRSAGRNRSEVPHESATSQRKYLGAGGAGVYPPLPAGRRPLRPAGHRTGSGAGGAGAGPAGPRPHSGGHPVLPRPCGPRGEQPLFSGEIPHPRGPHLSGGWDVRQPAEPEVLFSAPLPGHGGAGRRRTGPYAGRAHPRWGRPLLLRRGGVPDPPDPGTLRWAYFHPHPGRGVLCGGRPSLQGAAGRQAALLPVPPDGDGEPGEAAGAGL